MIAVNRIFHLILAFNLVALVFFFSASYSEQQSLSAQNGASLLRTSALTKPADLLDANITTTPKKSRPLAPKKAVKKKFTEETNPFNLLGAYPEFVTPIPHSTLVEKTLYRKINYGLVNDDNYCNKVDYFNIENPENMFDQMNFFSDYALNGVVRADVISKIGKDTMRKISKFSKKVVNAQERTNHFDRSITTFFVNKDNFHKYHKTGQHFLCATQMYNRIPGSRALIRKDELIESVEQYAEKFQDKPQCFNKEAYFPRAYRLYVESECSDFFMKINSEAYKKSLKTEPIQYIIKLSNSPDGAYLMDANQTEILNNKYHYGKDCGFDRSGLIAQTYITNPLLLNLKNKFDLRVYMLVASTNPLIVYYHDGFLRASLSESDKSSQDRSKNLTKTHIPESTLNDTETQKINNMTQEEPRDYQDWKFEQLQDYLFENDKISDSNWLENFLRPQFKKVIAHLIKMSSDFFWKQSNVYGLFGLDFMLDDKLNLWFIEASPSPQLLATSEFHGDVLLKNLFDIQYGLYRSRMMRVLKVVNKFQKASQKDKTKKIENWQQQYTEAAFNRFEPQYAIGKNNSWSLVMDESLPTAQAYFGNIVPECVL